MTEQELIKKLQSLKQIKPRENWVVFTKSQILNKQETPIIAKANPMGMLSNVFSMAFKRQYAYSFAVLLLVVTVGTFLVGSGIFPHANKNVAPASLLAIKDSVEDFKVKSRALSDVAQHNPEEIQVAAKEVESVAKELTVAIKNDPELAKEVALEINNNKTLLFVNGSEDLKETSDALYKTIVEQMVKDLEKTTLTESQEESLDVVRKFYDEGKYTNALESILLISVSVEEGK